MIDPDYQKKSLYNSDFFTEPYLHPCILNVSCPFQWEQFIFRTLYTAMTLDSLRNSRVIRQDANTPSEISANFDAISYKKVELYMTKVTQA